MSDQAGPIPSTPSASTLVTQYTPPPPPAPLEPQYDIGKTSIYAMASYGSFPGTFIP